jgi:Zn-dependent protease with chaperone function
LFRFFDVDTNIIALAPEPQAAAGCIGDQRRCTRTGVTTTRSRGRLLFPLLFVFLASGCATTQKNEVKALWLPPSQEAWAKVPPSGLTLRRRDGSGRFVSGPIVHNVVDVKADLERISGVRADLALVDMGTPNALAFEYQGRPVIALSLSWLDQLGQDPDALATTIGHELAHTYLGHTGAARKKREDTAQGTSQAVGTLLTLTGVPMGGAIAALGVTAVSRSFTRDEERAADEYGLRWAVAAGYDPCGRARTMKMYRQLREASADIPFLSTHPGASERSDLANEYSRKINHRACED